MTAARLSAMTENYLKVIWKAHEWSDDPITTNEIAAILGVAASSVSGNLAKLSRDGFIEHEPYGRIGLSEQGRLIAVQMVRRHRIIETYLVEHHGYGWDEVHEEADVLEHAISDRLLELYDIELGRPTHDPHGDPIPAADGSSVRPVGRRLHELLEGETGVVTRVSDHDPALLRYLAAMDIVIGTRIRVAAKHDYAGSMTVERLSGGDANTTSVELATVAANAIRIAADTDDTDTDDTAAD